MLQQVAFVETDENPFSPAPYKSSHHLIVKDISFLNAGKPKMSNEDWAALRAAEAERHTLFMEYGIERGWWKAVDEKGDPIPNDIIISIADLKSWETTMAHVMYNHSVFTSVSQARKNGWDIPVQKGEYYIKKSRQTILVTE